MDPPPPDGSFSVDRRLLERVEDLQVLIALSGPGDDTDDFDPTRRGLLGRPAGADRCRNGLGRLLVGLAGRTGRAAAIPLGRGRGAGRTREKYPGPSNSERGEEWILRDFFEDRRGGVFVDVGANHYREFSNTYYLETTLGWSGIAIEPQAAFAADYAKYRPKTTFVPLFISDVSNKDAVLFVPQSNHLVASADRAFAEDLGGTSAEVQARTTTLDDLLAHLAVDRIDFLTMDIELSEPAALRGFSIGRYRPALVCIEAHPEVRQEILDYFTRNGYVVVGETSARMGETSGSRPSRRRARRSYCGLATTLSLTAPANESCKGCSSYAPDLKSLSANDRNS